jgi:peptide/nickel transport system permease protein
MSDHTISAESDVPIAARAAKPPVRARGPWALVWERFRSDRLAVVAGIVLAVIIVLCFVGAPIASRLLGHGPNDQFPHAISEQLRPVGPWTRVPDVTGFVDVSPDTPTTLFVFGADGTLGRDLFLRVLYGGQVSLAVGLGAAFLALLIGVPVGIAAGYVGGWTDRTISWTTELFMGFPLLLFIVAIGYTVGPRLGEVTLRVVPPGVLVLVFLLGIFSWFLPARVIRAQVLSLRHDEFVEAARMVGARDAWIMRKHVLPHLVAPIVVWGTLITAGFVIFEAALAVLNVGVALPTASWGNLLSTNWGTLLVFDPLRTDPNNGYYVDKSNWVLFWPTAALVVTLLALALFGEGLRRAIDPRGNE